MANDTLTRRKLEKLPMDKRAKMVKATGKPWTEILDDPSLVDKHRDMMRCEGGTYFWENTDVIAPVDHLKLHDNFRERDQELTELKAAVDNRNQIQKLRMKISAQIGAIERRTDEATPEIMDFLKQELESVAAKEKEASKAVVTALKTIDDPIIAVAKKVRGISDITIAYMLVYADVFGIFPEKDGKGKDHPKAGQLKAPHASSLVKYVGLHVPSHKRYEKNTKGGGNKTLRTQLYAMMDSQIKTRGAYRDIYDATKDRLSTTTRTVKTRKAGKQGQMFDVAWNDPINKGHRHMTAIRTGIKRFLHDWWECYRKVYGVEAGLPWIVEQGHSDIQHHYSPPSDRGWEC